MASMLLALAAVRCPVCGADGRPCRESGRRVDTHEARWHLLIDLRGGHENPLKRYHHLIREHYKQRKGTDT